MAKERTLQNKVLAYLNSLGSDGHWINIHGSSFQTAGEPDIIGVYKGQFYAFELKREDGKGVVSDLQRYKLRKINEAGGIAMIVDNLEIIKELFDADDNKV